MLVIPALWFHYLEAKKPEVSDNEGEASLPFWLNLNSFTGKASGGRRGQLYICPHGEDGQPLRGGRERGAEL